jgi:hypothetical protein
MRDEFSCCRDCECLNLACLRNLSKLQLLPCRKFLQEQQTRRAKLGRIFNLAVEWKIFIKNPNFVQSHSFINTLRVKYEIWSYCAECTKTMTNFFLNTVWKINANALQWISKIQRLRAVKNFHMLQDENLRQVLGNVKINVYSPVKIVV